MQASEFPEFAVALYGEAEVAANCLRLQDQYGLDVNVVLLCCWFGLRHGDIDEDLWGVIDTISRRWQSHLIKPLREARRWLKNPAFAPDAELAELRERIAQNEIAAELVQQRWMERACADRKIGAPYTPADAVRRNLASYFARCATGSDQESEKMLAQIAAAACA